jgi:hypothetical protein
MLRKRNSREARMEAGSITVEGSCQRVWEMSDLDFMTELPIL